MAGFLVGGDSELVQIQLPLKGVKFVCFVVLRQNVVCEPNLVLQNKMSAVWCPVDDITVFCFLE